MKIFRLVRRKLIYLIIILIASFVFLNYLNSHNENQNHNEINKLKPEVIPIKKIDVAIEENVNKSKAIKSDGSVISNIYKDGLKNVFADNEYILALSKQRLNTLFSILKTKEIQYSDIFNTLNVFMFDKLSTYEEYSNEIKRYFETRNNVVEVNDKFIDDLKYLSNYYSYVYPRRTVKPEKIGVS